MTYDELMQMLQASQTGWDQAAGGMRIDSEGRRLMPGDIGYDAAPDPRGDRNAFSNGQTGNLGTFYGYDPTADAFSVAQGDSTSGIQRWNVDQNGTTDLGFEDIDRNGKWKQGVGTMAALLAGGSAAAYGAGLMGAAGGAASGAGSAGAGGLFADGATVSAINEAGGMGAFGSGGLGTAPAMATGSGAITADIAAQQALAQGIPADQLVQTMDGRVIDGVYRTGAEIGAMPGDMPPGVLTPDGGIDWGKLSQAAGGTGGIDWGKLLGQGASSLLSNGGLLSAGLGALAGVAGNGDMNSSTNSSSSSTGNQQSSSTGSSSTALAPWLQGYAQDYVSRAQQLAGSTSNGALDTAGGLLSQYATQGNPLVNAATAQQQNVIAGGLLGSNPYIDQVAQNIGNRMGDAYATGTRAGTFTGFNGDGNSVLGKSAFGQTLGNQDRAFADSLGSTMSNLYMGNYNTERAAQDAASRNSINLANFGVNNALNLGNFGAQAWQRPFAANQQYGAALNPAFGSQTNSAQTGNASTTQNATGQQNQNIQAPNNWMAGLGGAAMGAGMYRNILRG